MAPTILCHLGLLVLMLSVDSAGGDLVITKSLVKLIFCSYFFWQFSLPLPIMQLIY